MKTFIECPCGIAKADCTYHAAPDEPEPPTLPSPAADPLYAWIPPSFVPSYSFGRLTGPRLGSPPAKPAPKATRYGDGTHALDKICLCGEFIVRDGVSFCPNPVDVHGTRACYAHGQLISRTSATPKP